MTEYLIPYAGTEQSVRNFGISITNFTAEGKCLIPRNTTFLKKTSQGRVVVNTDLNEGHSHQFILQGKSIPVMEYLLDLGKRVRYGRILLTNAVLELQAVAGDAGYTLIAPEADDYVSESEAASSRAKVLEWRADIPRHADNASEDFYGSDASFSLFVDECEDILRDMGCIPKGTTLDDHAATWRVC